MRINLIKSCNKYQCYYLKIKNSQSAHENMLQITLISLVQANNKVCKWLIYARLQLTNKLATVHITSLIIFILIHK